MRFLLNHPHLDIIIFIKYLQYCQILIFEKIIISFSLVKPSIENTIIHENAIIFVPFSW